MNALEAFQQALVEGADDDALDIAAADVRRDGGAPALVEAIKMRIAHDLDQGKTDLDVTALRFRLAAALEEVAKTTTTPDGGRAALEAALLCREVLNDGEGAVRCLVLALKASVNDDAALKRTIEVAGGTENAEHMIERALKRPEVKADAPTTAALRRTLARIAEQGGDKERAFFESMKAARKAPSEGLFVDEVFRLALETGRHTEAAAFFGALADDGELGDRHRATLFNKLGQTLEKQGEKARALDAYVKSLRLHESKAPKRAVERLAAELGVSADVAEPKKITPEEIPDVTPPYDHASGSVTRPIDALAGSTTTPGSSPFGSTTPGSSPTGSVTARVDAPLPAIAAAPGEVTMPPRPAPASSSSRTIEPMGVPDLPADAADDDEGAPTFPSLPSLPRPISVPPAVPLSRRDTAESSSVTPPEGARDDEPDPPVVFNSIASLPSLDEQPPVLAGHNKEAPTEAPPRAPRLDPRPEQRVEFVAATVPELSKATRAPAPPPASSPSLSPAASSFAERERERELSVARSMESALAKLPDRAPEAVDEPTRRAPHASAFTEINSAEATSESLPSRRALKRGKGGKEKKEKTAKKKRPVAPSESRVLVDNSKLDGSPVGEPEPALASRPPAPAPSGARDAPASAPRARAAAAAAAFESVPEHTPSWRPSPAAAPPPRRLSDEALDAVGALDSGEGEAVHRLAPVASTSSGAAVTSGPFVDSGDGAGGAPDPLAGGSPDHGRAAPPDDEQTGRNPAAGVRARAAHVDPPTLESLPPLEIPPLSMPSMEATTTLSRAIAALESNDADECARAAVALASETPSDPRVIRLAARAMSLTAASGVMPKDAVEIFVAQAKHHGDRAAALALEVQAKVPAASVRLYTNVWLAAAKATGMDVARALDLLRTVAAEDAPRGPAFAYAERMLAEVNDATARDALYLAALKVATSDESKAELVRRRLALLESIQKLAEALPLHAQLAVELATSDLEARRAARRAFAERGSPDERARFLGKLARKLPGDDGIEIVQELLDVRLSVDDRIGAEAAVKDLLARKPGDPRATKVLADLLEDDPRRTEELIDALRTAAHHALNAAGKTSDARILFERIALVQQKAGRPEEASDTLVQIARLVPEERHIDRALEALDAVKRHKEAVALLEETASAVADIGFRARTLLRSAEIARTKLQKRGKARELVERALELMPRDKAALREYAELLVEIGDAAAAVTALERLAAEERDAKQTSALQLRIGKLIEEHLLKPDEALRRYRAAAEVDHSNKEAWSALRAAARQRGDRALLVESLRGLAGAESDPKEKAALLRQTAKVERDERVDVAAAEKAFADALKCDPSDVESLMSLAALFAARLQPDTDLDAALAQPNDALLDALRGFLLKASPPANQPPAAKDSPKDAKDAKDKDKDQPLVVRRLHAMAASRSGDRAAATERFDRLVAEHPEDLPTLLALARHLAAAPRGEAGADVRRLRCLETILLHHAYSLKPAVQVDVWGDVTALRAATGDGGGARKAAKKVMAIATTDELKGCLSDRAVRAVALALDDARDAERSPQAIIAALRLDAERSIVAAERCRLLERAAVVATEEMKDRIAARALLEDAVRANPSSHTAREALLDLDVASGDVAGAIKQVRDLLARENESAKRATLQMRLFRLKKKHGVDIDSAAADLKAAVDSDPTNAEVLDAAELHFTEKNDTEGLDKLWSAQLRAMDRLDIKPRLKLLERLSQLRRYERRDLTGAVEALEAMTALDPEALKPREDAARLYTELGLSREAVAAWRGVLERDPLQGEAWRGIFSRFAATRQGDEAFATASTMLALDLADDETARACRAIRPPFPRWPIPPKDLGVFRKKAAHPLERTAVRAVLDACGPRLLPMYARNLKEFGFRRRDALQDKNVPTSVLLAVRTLAQLLGLPPPPLFLAELGVTNDAPSHGGAAAQAAGPPFAVLAATEPGIIVTSEVIKGGMTPERAFSLGRAASWLQPHAVMAAAVDAPTLRAILEGLVAAFLGPKNLERPDLDAEKLGKELSHLLLTGLSSNDEAQLKADLLPALRDYVHARQQVQVADWRAGVGYTGDRVGFLMSTDLNAAFRMIKASAGTGQSIGARLAIKELVLFSVSAAYMSLRKDLGLALPELAASPLLELG